MFSKPIMIFGAKKFKARATLSLSTTTTNCYIWKDNDSKLWKEKNAVGKLIKQISSKYIGILLPLSYNYFKHPITATTNTTTTTTSINHDNNDNNNNGSIEDSIVISVRTPGLDKLIHIHSVAVKSFLDYKSFATITAAAAATTAVITTTTTTTSTSTVAVANNSTTTTINTISSPIENDNNDSSKINNKSMIASSIINNYSNVHETTIINSLDILLESSLKNKFNMKIDNKQNNLLSSLPLIHIRSKQPRHMTDSNGNVIHTVAYSKESRVKAPSRKNIVID